MERVYRYLSGTCDFMLTYGGDKHNLQGHTDADGASQEHWCVISGYCFSINGGAVSQGSKKQELVTLSTVEVEYVVATHTSKEAVWLCHLNIFRFCSRQHNKLLLLGAPQNCASVDAEALKQYPEIAQRCSCDAPSASVCPCKLCLSPP